MCFYSWHRLTQRLSELHTVDVTGHPIRMCWYRVSAKGGNRQGRISGQYLLLAKTSTQNSWQANLCSMICVHDFVTSLQCHPRFWSCILAVSMNRHACACSCSTGTRSPFGPAVQHLHVCSCWQPRCSRNTNSKWCLLSAVYELWCKLALAKWGWKMTC